MHSMQDAAADLDLDQSIISRKDTKIKIFRAAIFHHFWAKAISSLTIP